MNVRETLFRPVIYCDDSFHVEHPVPLPSRSSRETRLSVQKSVPRTLSMLSSESISGNSFISPRHPHPHHALALHVTTHRRLLQIGDYLNESFASIHRTRSAEVMIHDAGISAAGYVHISSLPVCLFIHLALTNARLLLQPRGLLYGVFPGFCVAECAIGTGEWAPRSKYVH